jgi:hypothetical protein
VRFLIAVVALAAAAGAAYRAVQHEQQLARDAVAASHAQAASETSLVTLSDLRGALHAYLAEGQSATFWVARANLLLDKLRATLLELETIAGPAGVPLTETLDAVDRLAAVEQRAREHLRAAQLVLAGEAIFTDARDLAEAMRLQIVRARNQIAVATGRRVVELRREQTLLLGSAVGVLAFVLLLLVPVPSREVPVVIQKSSPTPMDPLDEFPLPRAKPLVTRTPVAPAPARASASARPASQRELRRDLAEAASGREGGPVAPSAPSAPSAPVAVPPAGLASLCTDLARLADSSELSGLLTRAVGLLDASGLVLWLVSADGRELLPVASAGYDQRMVNRLQPISRDASTLTTDAFREKRSQTSRRGDGASAALAIPLPSPTGAAGVLSAELHGDADVNDTRIATAEIIAAQLAVIVGTKSANSDVA